MAHASRALQSHDLSGEGINYGSHTFFDHTRTWRASPYEGSAQCRDYLRNNEDMKDDTHHSCTHSFEQSDYERMIMTTKLYLKAEFILNEKFWSHYLSLASPFTWPTPPGPYRATICRGRKKLWITYFFWPHKDMEGLPGWVISPMPGPPPRQHKHERQDTRSTHSVIPTRRIWKDDYDSQMIFGDLEGLKFPDICLTGEEKPRKTSPTKLVPTGDRTRARCVTSAYATTCSTAVDFNKKLVF